MTGSAVDPQHVIVVGAGPGLGAAIARRFGREGFAVTLVARHERNLAELAGRLRDAGVPVDTVTADVADAHGFRTALEELARRTTPGVVVYNLASIAPDRILTSDVDHLLVTYAVDVVGAVTAAQVFTPAMRRAGRGTFLATGGHPSVAPEPRYATLSLGKAGLRAAVSLLHDDLKADGVHVAGIRIEGAIIPGTALDPGRIADTYWALHTQPPGEWSAETVVDGPGEPGRAGAATP
ncbi:SDR family NAD(P)-dependent oxidoreductase [Pseudonocardia kujensis]|uniref:SDR family NAD(P)-dependent oxidoreductase n=1 Tax=Pseudonocardia kujensis TaxID=1128675 RepID=UPI001E4DD58D|nr:SDR family NAD(P)-dependent oxidoreductase [Pseudonocardia kujensis]MCE0765290.1 SDR family NAD(P)-dependent oxidoreductase [Pseudonocardia kujensis]